MRGGIIFIAIAFLTGCASRARVALPGSGGAPAVTAATALSAPAATALTNESLEAWIARQEPLSWAMMKRNISPAEPKQAGGPLPRKGVVVAALQKKDPDYYFHWVRDSAHVMLVMARAFALKREMADTKAVKTAWHDFLVLSRALQTQPSTFGFGEPRFQVDGQPDRLPWSRPQFDGPALRALAVLEALRASLLEPKDRALAEQILRADLDFIRDHWRERGFDLWEEYKGDGYHTRLVQLAALEQGGVYAAAHASAHLDRAGYARASQGLLTALEDHWDPARGFLRSQTVIVATDGWTAKQTDLDSAVIMAVVEAGRASGPHSVLDDRVHATVQVLEDLFRSLYPINARADVGLAYGRYKGDVYYGGNAFYFITAPFAEFFYQLGARLHAGATLTVTARNLKFVRAHLPAPFEVQIGQTLLASDSRHAAFARAMRQEGERILARLRLHTPSDGELSEQFDKTSGQPVSARGIGWSHSSLLSAFFTRAQTAVAR